MKLSQFAGNAVTGIVLVCSVVTTTAVVRRSVGSSRSVRPAAPVSVRDWQTFLASGNRIGSFTAPVVILEFGDFQCPACRAFARQAWSGIHHKYGDSVALVFRNWPLPYHRYAYEAAVAGECAAQVGKFPDFYEYIYSHPDSLGIESYFTIATKIGIAAAKGFTDCVAGPRPNAKVEADLAAARKLGGTGTPTLVIDGMRYSRAPDSLWLDSVVAAMLVKSRRPAR